MSTTSSYEAVVVYSLTQGEEAVFALRDRFKALIEQSGTLENVDEWGKRRLAYTIQDETEGYYVLYTFQCGSEFPTEFDRVQRITDGVLRGLIVKKELPRHAAQKAAAAAKAAAAKAAEEAQAAALAAQSAHVQEAEPPADGGDEPNA